MFLSGLLILVLSFVPMLLYALVLWWLDRYEKEPFGLLTVSFLWGAVPSIVLALIMQIALDVPLTAIQSSSQLTYELLGASVVAPLTEEGIKALALILLLLLFKREIDSPLDGVIYGGMVGFGFAAVENVFYLFGALTEGGVGEVLGLAFMRVGIFGLNHAMYTGFTGSVLPCSSKSETECYVSFLWCLDSCCRSVPMRSTMRWPRSQVWVELVRLWRRCWSTGQVSSSSLWWPWARSSWSGNASWPTPIRWSGDRSYPRVRWPCSSQRSSAAWHGLTCSCGATSSGGGRCSATTRR